MIKPFDPEKWHTRHSDYLLLWNDWNWTIGNYSYTENGKGRWRNWRGIVIPTHWLPMPPDGPKEK